MTKATKKKPTIVKPPQATAPAASQKKCQAKKVGHRSCHCGSPDCGENIGGR